MKTQKFTNCKTEFFVVQIKATYFVAHSFIEKVKKSNI